MGKYDALWQHIGKDGRAEFMLTFDEIARIAGIPIDHSFLNCKNELLSYGYRVGKISLKGKTVSFLKME